MPTRFFLPYNQPADIEPAFDGQWEFSIYPAMRSQMLRRPLRTGFLSWTWNKGAFNNNQQDWPFHQFVSRPLKAQTISGTMLANLWARESTSSYNLRTQIIARVVASDGTVRGYLYSGDLSTTSPTASQEWYVHASNFSNRDAPRTGSATISSLQVQEGDRIVVEVGGRMLATTTSTGSLSMVFGDGGVSWNAAGNSTTSSMMNSWIEFSGDILFQREPDAPTTPETSGLYADLVLAEPSLLLYWPLDEKPDIPAPYVADASGNDRYGWIEQATVNYAGLLEDDDGSSFSFDGVNDGVSAWQDSTLSRTSLTAELMFKTSSATGTQTFVTELGVWSMYFGGGNLYFFNYNGSVAEAIPGTWNDGNPHHLVVRLQSGVTNGSTVWIDGVVRATFTWNRLDASGPLRLGSAGEFHYAGQLDEFAFYGDILPDATIEEHADIALNGNPVVNADVVLDGVSGESVAQAISAVTASATLLTPTSASVTAVSPNAVGIRNVSETLVSVSATATAVALNAVGVRNTSETLAVVAASVTAVAPVVSATRNTSTALISVSATATVSIPSAVGIRNVSEALATASATASATAPVVSAVRVASVTMAVVGAVASAVAPEATGQRNASVSLVATSVELVADNVSASAGATATLSAFPLPTLMMSPDVTRDAVSNLDIRYVGSPEIIEGPNGEDAWAMTPIDGLRLDNLNGSPFGSREGTALIRVRYGVETEGYVTPAITTYEDGDPRFVLGRYSSGGSYSSNGNGIAANPVLLSEQWYTQSLRFLPYSDVGFTSHIYVDDEFVHSRHSPAAHDMSANDEIRVGGTTTVRAVDVAGVILFDYDVSEEEVLRIVRIEGPWTWEDVGRHAIASDSSSSAIDVATGAKAALTPVSATSSAVVVAVSAIRSTSTTLPVTSADAAAAPVSVSTASSTPLATASAEVQVTTPVITGSSLQALSAVSSTVQVSGLEVETGSRVVLPSIASVAQVYSVETAGGVNVGLNPANASVTAESPVAETGSRTAILPVDASLSAEALIPSGGSGSFLVSIAATSSASPISISTASMALLTGASSTASIESFSVSTASATTLTSASATISIDSPTARASALVAIPSVSIAAVLAAPAFDTQVVTQLNSTSAVAGAVVPDVAAGSIASMSMASASSLANPFSIVTSSLVPVSSVSAMATVSSLSAQTGSIVPTSSLESSILAIAPSFQTGSSILPESVLLTATVRAPGLSVNPDGPAQWGWETVVRSARAPSTAILEIRQIETDVAFTVLNPASANVYAEVFSTSSRTMSISTGPGLAVSRPATAIVNRSLGGNNE